jgi:hypothetical protein
MMRKEKTKMSEINELMMGEQGGQKTWRMRKKVSQSWEKLKI